MHTCGSKKESPSIPSSLCSPLRHCFGSSLYHSLSPFFPLFPLNFSFLSVFPLLFTFFFLSFSHPPSLLFSFFLPFLHPPDTLSHSPHSYPVSLFHFSTWCWSISLSISPSLSFLIPGFWSTSWPFSFSSSLSNLSPLSRLCWKANGDRRTLSLFLVNKQSKAGNYNTTTLRQQSTSKHILFPLFPSSSLFFHFSSFTRPFLSHTHSFYHRRSSFAVLLLLTRRSVRFLRHHFSFLSASSFSCSPLTAHQSPYQQECNICE